MKRSAILLAMALTVTGCSSKRASDPAEVERGPLSVLYSIRDNDRGTLVGVYRASVPNGRPLTMPSPERLDGAFGSSPDGRFILRRTPYNLTSADLHSELAVASSDDPTSFRTLVKVRGSYIEEVLWAPDGDPIFYLQSVSTETVTRHELRSIRRDGSEPRLIRRLEVTADVPVTLAAFHSDRGMLYLTHEFFSDDSSADGHRTHITAVDLSDGSSDRVDVSINPIPGPDLAFAPDGSRLYYLAGSRIIERTLADGRERILYRSDEETTFVHDILVSPDGETLYFEAERRSAISTGTVFALRLGDLKAKVIYEYRRSGEGGPIRLSPDGFWMWFTDGDANHRLLDLRDLEVHPFIREPPGDDLGFDFLTWVVT